MDKQIQFEKIEKLYLKEQYEECKKVSEELLEVIDNDFDKVELLHAIADCILKLGNDKDSLPIYYKALGMARKINFLDELILILTMLADIEYSTLKNSEKAIEYLTECIEKSKELNDYYYIESSLTMLARIYYNSDDYSQALVFLSEALIYLDSQSKDYLKDYFNINCILGICNLSLGNYESFEEYYFAAFDSLRKAQAITNEDKLYLSIAFDPSYVLSVICREDTNHSILSNLIEKLFPIKYEDILYLLACEEDSYKDNTIPVLLDVLDGKYTQEVKISAVKAISYILGPDDVYFTKKLERKYRQYRLISMMNKKVAELCYQLKIAIVHIKSKKACNE